MKKNLFSTSVFLCLIIFSAFRVCSQTVVDIHKVIVVNSGEFEFAPPFNDYVTVSIFNRFTRNDFQVDTIYTQSAQDLLLDNYDLYIAAGDSIIKYNVHDGIQRVAANQFGAASTIKLQATPSYLFVGNWYGSTDNNLRIFDKNTLAFIDSIPEIELGAKDMIVIGDTLYVQQNYTNSSFEDSAGFFSVVSISQKKFIREIHFNNNGADLGGLHKKDSVIYAFNSVSNSVTKYDVTTGTWSTDTLVGDIQLGPYGKQSNLYGDTIYFKYDNGIGTYDIPSGTVGNTYLKDTVITAFAYDYLHEWFFVNQTDYGTFSRGRTYARNGAIVDTFLTGISPESLALFYTLEIGTEEHQGKPDFTMFPNPAGSQSTIVPGTMQTYDLQLYSITGKLLFRVPSIRNKYTLDMNEYPAGIYMVRLVTTEGSFAKRLIKR